MRNIFRFYVLLIFYSLHVVLCESPRGLGGPSFLLAAKRRSPFARLLKGRLKALSCGFHAGVLQGPCPTTPSHAKRKNKHTATNQTETNSRIYIHVFRSLAAYVSIMHRVCCWHKIEAFRVNKYFRSPIFTRNGPLGETLYSTQVVVEVSMDIAFGAQTVVRCDI